MDIYIYCGKFEIGIKEFDKYKYGRLMYDIACCMPEICNNKESYMELLEATAEDILSRLNT
jgi:hypothetical protein